MKYRIGKNGKLRDFNTDRGKRRGLRETIEELSDKCPGCSARRAARKLKQTKKHHG